MARREGERHRFSVNPFAAASSATYDLLSNWSQIALRFEEETEPEENQRVATEAPATSGNKRQPGRYQLAKRHPRGTRLRAGFRARGGDISPPIGFDAPPPPFRRRSLANPYLLRSGDGQNWAAPARSSSGSQRADREQKGRDRNRRLWERTRKRCAPRNSSCRDDDVPDSVVGMT